MISKKGGAFEKEIAKQLSLWWTQTFKKPRDDIFYKSTGSGNRATIRMKKNIKTANSYGDITILDPIGLPVLRLFLIECKRGYTGKRRISENEILETKKAKNNKDFIKEIRKLLSRARPSREVIDPLEMIDGKKNIKNEPLILEWWKKATKENLKAKRKFVAIIFRRDSKETAICLPIYFFKIYTQVDHRFLPFKRTMMEILHEDGTTHLIIINFNYFLKWAKPKYIRQMLRVLNEKET